MYDLSHLDPSSFEVVWPAQDDTRPEKRISIIVEYSMHCFTVGMPSDDPKYLRALEYWDNREIRQFNVERYEHSKLLRKLMVSFVDGAKQHCYQTQHKNYFTILPHPDAISTHGYCIYFTLGKREKGDADLTLYVQSAYCQAMPQTARQKPCSFKELCARTMRK